MITLEAREIKETSPPSEEGRDGEDRIKDWVRVRTRLRVDLATRSQAI